MRSIHGPVSGANDGSYFSMTLCTQLCEPKLKLLKGLQAGKAVAKSIWSQAQPKTFNIGIESAGKTPQPTSEKREC